MCLRFQFCTHQRVCTLHFLKKIQIRCTLMYILNLSPHKPQFQQSAVATPLYSLLETPTCKTGYVSQLHAQIAGQWGQTM
jgi:hypothetical protein